MSLKKLILILILVGIAVVGVQTWLDKPYCTIEHLDRNTVKGKKNPLVYAVSKLFTSRTELKGADPYTMYLYINDPDGIRSTRFTVNGNTVALNIPEGQTVFEYELDGPTDFGLHRFSLHVKDGKGNEAAAEAIVKVSPMAGAMIPMI